MSDRATMLVRYVGAYGRRSPAYALVVGQTFFKQIHEVTRAQGRLLVDGSSEWEEVVETCEFVDLHNNRCTKPRVGLSRFCAEHITAGKRPHVRTVSVDRYPKRQRRC